MSYEYDEELRDSISDEIFDANDEFLWHCDYIDIDELYSLDSTMYLSHIGVGPDDNPPGRGSGRYAKGSGENPYQHDFTLAKTVSNLKKQNIPIGDIAKGLGYKSSQDLRQALSIENDRRKAHFSKVVPELGAKGKSVKEIAAETGLSASSVRNYLNTDRKIQTGRTNRIADVLKEEVDKKHYIDIGPGVEHSNNLQCSKTRLKTAVKQLEDQGYHRFVVKVPQLGNPDQTTNISVLAYPDGAWKYPQNDPSLIKPFQGFVAQDGDSVRGLKRPKSIDSSRVYIRYTDESGKGGAEKDGLVELRRGVEDISLGKSTYSQVRIGVDDKYYMKGMAVYSDNIPDGYDIIYNTNKKYGTPPEKVFKPMKTVNPKDPNSPIDWTNPFGATIKEFKAGGQRIYVDKDGKEQLSVINKVNDQGDWAGWSKTISSQILSKQPTTLVKKQLDLTYKDKLQEYNEIMSLTNPTVQRKLLYSFADDCDANAAHLKAKAFHDQAYYSILPIPSLKGDDAYYKANHIDGECYAPKYEHGELLALFRSPHASTSEIPIVRVNNNNKEAKAAIGNAGDAIGINAHIAEKLSGADFDGDTVIAVPLKTTNIQAKPTLEGLKNFSTKDYAFPDPDHAKIISSQAKQTQMGMITNLITDMSFRDGVTPDEMTRAIKHSMVIIDAEKHKLDWKRSEEENRIKELKDKYQRDSEGHTGAGTIISRAGSEAHIPQRKLGSIEDPVTGKKHYGIDPDTGDYIYVDTGKTKMVRKPTKNDPDRLVEVPITQKIDKMYLYSDARDLMSDRDNPHPTELVYANFANQMKQLARDARKSYLNVPRLKKDPEAEKKYAEEVASLNSKLILAESNSPKERIAQAIAATNYKEALRANPHLKEDKEHLSRLRGQFLAGARIATGAGKQYIDITDREWDAIQHAAISETKLMSILNNTKPERIRQLATPHRETAISPAVKAGIRAMAGRANGPTLKQIAEQYGISPSQVSKIVNGKDE